jgi:mannose-6-phosphate isomerase-like protein (cupin superfamily)
MRASASAVLSRTVGERVALLVGLTLLAVAGAALILALFHPHAAAAAPASPAAAGAAEVHYFPASEVQAAFDKGAVLLNAGTYMVHASRRDTAGKAEVHLKDTDIIHVLRGTATVVTGGSVVGGEATAEDEVRGASIEKGTTRHLAEGDVLVVPNGVPHWFSEVNGAFLYYVVKVR